MEKMLETAAERMKRTMPKSSGCRHSLTRYLGAATVRERLQNRSLTVAARKYFDEANTIRVRAVSTKNACLRSSKPSTVAVVNAKGAEMTNTRSRARPSFSAVKCELFMIAADS